MKDTVFTQAQYTNLVDALDAAIEGLRDTGKSEEQAQEWLKDFVTNHFCPVWRAMSVDR